MSLALCILSILICHCVMVHSLTYRGTISLGGVGNVDVSGANCGAEVTNNGITLHQDCAPRVHFTSGGNLYRFRNLLAKSIKFTVDVSNADCGCNAAVYFVQPRSWTQDYCDAQGPENGWCNEIDLMEANAHAFQATLHCGTGSGDCKNGCAMGFKSGDGYGPGGSKVDTRYPFDVTVSFVRSKGTLSAVRIQLSQSGKKKSITGRLIDSICKSNGASFDTYVSGLTSAMSSGELAMAVSYWSWEQMGWLDGSECTSNQKYNFRCSRTGGNAVSFKNFQIMDYSSETSDDETSPTSDNSSLYAVIGLVVVVVILIAVIIVIVVRKRKAVETV